MRLLLAMLVVLTLPGCQQAAPSAPFVMPKETYTPGDSSLVNPKPKALDHELRKAVARYRATDSDAARQAIRDALSGYDLDTLDTFARRAAVFGMRDRDPGWLEGGLTAVTMFSYDRVEDGDILPPVARLHYASERIGANTARMFRDIAPLAEPRIAEMVGRFPRRDDLGPERWLFMEIPTGFLARDIHPYAPTVDLPKAIVRLAAVVEADGKYPVTHVAVAAAPPPGIITGVGTALLSARGGAMVDTPGRNGLTLYLLEMPDAAAAAAMQEAATQRPVTRSMPLAGVARGKLFCLIVARGETDETPATLQRFVAPVTEILDTTS